MESKKFKVFVEYKVARESKEPDIPDLFLITPNAFYFIEEKGSLPRDHAKLDLEITKVLGYRSDHAFEGAKFVPQIILLCPSRIYEERASRLRYYGKELPIVTYDAPLEDPIVLKQVQGQVLDSKIKPFLTGSSRIPHARSVV
ncbi:MAG: hypothetical protein HYU39_06585, partial [Thaumarchaeota archaeon]|nr:hypothetical protein [Nitrososphaerota archaeon]